MPALAFAQCPPDWLSGAPAAINAGEFRALTTFDPDGPGPAHADLYVGGFFQGLSPGVPAARAVARWDGVRWYPAVFNSPTDNGTVHTFAVFDFDADGPDPARLVVGGSFTLGFGGSAANNILSSSGTGYTRLSDGFDSAVYDLLAFDPDADGPLPVSLYAAGNFRRSGSRTVTPVVRWSGSQWESVGSNLSGTADALAIYDADGAGPLPPRLVAGGRLTAGQAANVAVFDGSTWTRLGSLDDEVFDLTTFDLDGAGPNPARLIAVGRFRNTSLNGQAYFNGTSWQSIAPVANFPTGTIRTATVEDSDADGPLPPRLLVGGMIYLPGQNAAHRVVTLANGVWTPIVNNTFAGEVFSLRQLTLPGEDHPVVIAGGTLESPPPARTAYRLTRIDGSSAAPFAPGLSSSVAVIAPTTVTGTPSLFIAGGGIPIPGHVPSSLSLYDGTSFTPIGTPGEQVFLDAAISVDPDGPANPLTEILVLGGLIDSIDGVTMQNVASYDGISWRAMGAIPTYPSDFELYDPDGPGPENPMLLAAGGSPSGGPGVPAFVYRWTGAQWVQFGPSFTSVNGPAQVNSLASFDPDADGPAPRQLVVVGFFNRAGNLFANSAAVYNGRTWSAMGSGFGTNPPLAYTWDPQHNGHEVVIVTGAFTTAGGVPARGAAVWNGSAWSALGTGFGASTVENYPLAFTIFRDDLYAGGFFQESTGGPGNSIARWNGSAWERLGDGLEPPSVFTMATLPASETRPETLAVGGNFLVAGGRPSAFLAFYTSRPCCPADANADGVVDSADFFLFVTRFMKLDPAADLNDDGTVNSRDFFDYLVAYFGGC